MSKRKILVAMVVATQILLVLSMVFIAINQILLSGIAYGIIIILAILGFYIKIQETNENRKRVFDEYQKIKDLTLKEIIENAKNSDDINSISINILKNIIQENEEK